MPQNTLIEEGMIVQRLRGKGLVVESTGLRLEVYAICPPRQGDWYLKPTGAKKGQFKLYFRSQFGQAKEHNRPIIVTNQMPAPSRRRERWLIFGKTN